MNKHPFRFFAFAAVAVLSLVAVSARAADTLATWKLVNTLDGTTDYTDALAVGSITNGSAVSSLSLSKNGYSGQGWDGSSRKDNAYFQFSLTATDDYNLILGELALHIRSTQTGPKQAEVRWSLNGSTWTSAGTFGLTNDNDDKGFPYTISLSGVTVGEGDTLTVRLYAWDASAKNGSLRIGNGSPMTLSGTAVGTKLPPTVSFPNAAEAVAVSNKLTVNITVLPDGSGIKTWSFLPKPSGTYYLQTATKRFTFTPAMADEGSVFTLSVTATNSYGTTTAELPVTVTEFMPPGSWFTGFETGVDPYYPKSPTDIAIDERMWTIQQLAFLSSNTIPKVGARACVFGSYSEAYMVSDDKLLDASHGFGTVSFQYAAYPGETAACQPLIFEIATDLAQGNWIELGRVNPNGKDTLEREEFVLNTTEPVYMRIRTEYVNNSGRVVLDQLAVTPCELPERTAFETYLLKYNVTPGDPGSAESDDFDEDGYSNLAEFNATPQTNPYDRTSHP